MIPLGLRGDTVITLSEGPVLVAGFEAKHVEDDMRQRQVRNCCSRILCKETKFMACQNCHYATLYKHSRDTGRSKNEFAQRVECFKVNGKNCGVGKEARNSVHQKGANIFPRAQKKAACMQKKKKVS